jgi:GDP-4-dehydro-6-deoxy-D-mannose reductase
VKILVTGGRGFVGRHLAALLLSAGHEVVILDVPRVSGADGAGAPKAAETESGEGEIYECDILDFKRLAGLMRKVKPDAVVHLAALSSAGRSFMNPTEAFEVNTQGTMNTLEAVKGAGLHPRVLIVSSAEVYCAPDGDGPLSEDSPIGPVSPYALGKACAELVAFHYQSVWGVDVVVVRPFNHTGPGQTDVFVLPSFAKQIVEAEKGLREPKLSVGDLNVTRDFSDVRDVVAAYRLLLERRPRGRIYNVCSGRGYVIRELLDRLISLSKIKMEIGVDQARLRTNETPALVGDNALITRDLGWRPRIQIEQTLEDLLEHWRAKV